MSHILITGGNGQLGRSLVSILAPRAEHTVRVMSRQPRPDSAPSNLERAQSDLETGAGVQQAVAGVSHVIYISIVGVDRISGYPYYAAKLAAEQLVAESGIPWSILRATQFHYLLDMGLQWLSRSPVVPLPTDFPFQPIAQEEVAQALARNVDGGPAGRLPDMGGPEVLTVGELARTWLQIRGMRRLVLPLHVPGAAAAGFRRGEHTCPQNRQGRITWREWVQRAHSKSTNPRRASTPSLSRGH